MLPSARAGRGVDLLNERPIACGVLLVQIRNPRHHINVHTHRAQVIVGSGGPVFQCRARGIERLTSGRVFELVGEMRGL